MRSTLTVGFLLIVLSTAGCAKDLGFEFPDNGERVLVRVKVQQDLQLSPMKAIYRSDLCTFTDYGYRGIPYERDGYNNIVKRAKPNDEGSVYSVAFDIDGGGQCKWKLSNLTFGVQYKYPERFGIDRQVSGAGGVTVVFDDNRPQRSAEYIVVSGDIEIKEDYYLWVADREGKTPRVNVGLLAEDDLFLSYKTSGTRSIYFEPNLHSEYVIHSSMSKAKGKGYDVTFTYPDGSVINDGRVSPDFKRLECIRLRSQCED